MGNMKMGSMKMGGTSMPKAMHGHAASGTLNLLPTWLAVALAVVFAGVFLAHLRHAAETHGQRRLWHCGHVLMACSMVFMTLPASSDPFPLPDGLWRGMFAIALAATLAAVAVQAATSALWIVLATDLAAMVYMWSPAAFRWPVTLAFGGCLALEAWLWTSDRAGSLERPLRVGRVAVDPDGALGLAAAVPLASHRDLRVSMTMMSAGMAYMIVAMQLMR